MTDAAAQPVYCKCPPGPNAPALVMRAGRWICKACHLEVPDSTSNDGRPARIEFPSDLDF